MGYRVCVQQAKKVDWPEKFNPVRAQEKGDVWPQKRKEVGLREGILANRRVWEGATTGISPHFRRKD